MTDWLRIFFETDCCEKGRKLRVFLCLFVKFSSVGKWEPEIAPLRTEQ
jgi:hypothetical protein